MKRNSKPKKGTHKTNPTSLTLRHLFMLSVLPKRPGMAASAIKAQLSKKKLDRVPTGALHITLYRMHGAGLIRQVKQRGRRTRYCTTTKGRSLLKQASHTFTTK